MQTSTVCLQCSSVRILLHSTDINTAQQEGKLGEIILYSAFTILTTVKSEDTINKYQSMTSNAISSSMQIPHLSSPFNVAETQPAPSNKFSRSFSSYTFQDMASDLWITGREDMKWMNHEGEYSGSKTHKKFLGTPTFPGSLCHWKCPPVYTAKPSLNVTDGGVTINKTSTFRHIHHLDFCQTTNLGNPETSSFWWNQLSIKKLSSFQIFQQKQIQFRKYRV